MKECFTAPASKSKAIVKINIGDSTYDPTVRYGFTYYCNCETIKKNDDELIAKENEENINYFLGDALGNVRQLVSGAAPETKVLLTREYSPYGEIVSQNGTGEVGIWVHR
jgi:hypothetical protein